MKPLAGTRIIDFTQVLAGPLCTQYLGDLGADVIKIEPARGGDDARRWPPFRDGYGCMFVSINRNKRSVALDLKAEGGRALVQRLVRGADVVVESFATGVAERLGIDYPTLKAIRPDLVYCSISGFGRTGPLRDRRGYDLILQAFTGIMDMTGHEDTGPTRVPLSPIDQTTGMHAVTGILAALLGRAKTGEGAFLEVSLFETAVGFLGFNLERLWARGTLPAKSGSGHEVLCPYQVFRASDGNVLVGIANNNLWRRFCEMQGRPELIEDPRFKDNPTRVENMGETLALMREIVATRTVAEWLEALGAIGVPCAPVNTMEDLMREPHTAARGIVMDYDHPKLGPMRAVAHPVQFNGEKRSVDRPPPRLGEHTVGVLAELGLDPTEIEQLARDGVVVDGTEAPS